MLAFLTLFTKRTVWFNVTQKIHNTSSDYMRIAGFILPYFTYSFCFISTDIKILDYFRFDHIFHW